MDKKEIAYGILAGISSVPGGIYNGIKRTWQGSGLSGSDLKSRNQIETERFFKLVKSLGNKEEPVRRLITTVMLDFYERLDESTRSAINDKIGYGLGRLAGKTGAQFMFAHTVTTTMIRHAASTYAWRKFIHFGTSFSLNILMIQGLIEEAALASRRMQYKYRMTYDKVSQNNLDMVYFLVEPQLEPYLEYLNGHNIICKGVQSEICKILGS